MELHLLQTLRKIKRVEDDQTLNYQPKTIDVNNFVPKYSNVIIVDQSMDDSTHIDLRRPTNSDNTLIQTQLRTNRIDRALAHAMNYSRSPLFNDGWSIFLKEGLYIIGQYHFRRICCMKLNLEIVGLHEVRILCQEDIQDYVPLIFSTQSNRLTLNNIKIYDMRTRKSTPGATAGSRDDSRVTLANVFIHAPSAVALDTRDGSSAHIENCTFTACWCGIYATEKSIIHMEQSCVSNMINHGVKVLKDSVFNVSESRFFCAGEIFVNHSQGVLTECRVENNQSDADTKATPVMVMNEGRITCEKTMFRGYNQIFQVKGSKTEATINSCVLINSAAIARVVENGSLTVNSCVIDVSYSLVYVTTNIKGKIQLKKNKLRESTPRTIFIDSVSKKPEHDEDINFQPLVYRPDLAPSDKEKSKYTQSVQQHVRFDKNFDVMGKIKDKRYKACAKCLKPESTGAVYASGYHESTTPKFRYCGGCRLVNYCSEECKNAHWADHRLICERKHSSVQ